MAELDRLHDTGDDFTSAILEFFILALTLSIAHLLEDNLLCRLCVDATQINRGQRIDDEVANLGTGLQLFGLLQVDLLEIIVDRFDNLDNTPQAKVAGLSVQLGTNIVFSAITGARSALDGFFKRFDDDRLVDHLFAGNSIGNCKQFGLVGCNRTGHDFSLPVLRRGCLRRFRRPRRC